LAADDPRRPGGFVAYFSFGSCHAWQTRLDKVGEAAVLARTSTVFAALIGWFGAERKP